MRIHRKVVTLQDLPSQVRDILIGCMISDATCTKRGNKAHLKISHSTKQIGYAQWKLEMLKGYVEPGRKLSYSENFKKNKESKHWLWFNGVEFNTLASYFGAELKALFSTKPFYMGSRKAIPDNIGDFMTALVFAVMLGDDGKTKHLSGYYELCLQCYSYEELIILNEAINNKLGLNGNVVPHETPNRFIIRYPTSNSIRIGDIISDNLPACMHFKILKTDSRHIHVATGAGLPLPLRGDRSKWRDWYELVKLNPDLGETMGYLKWLNHNSDQKQDPEYLYDVKLNSIQLDGIQTCELPGQRIE
jgi:hypothetical protein